MSIEEVIGTVTAGEAPATTTTVEENPVAAFFDPLSEALPDDAAVLSEEKKNKRERGELPASETTETEAESTTETVVKAESKPDGGLKLDDQLVDYAVRLGLPLSAARAFPTTQALEQHLSNLVRSYGPANQQQQPQPQTAPVDDFDLAQALGDDVDPKIKETLIKAFDKQKATQNELTQQLYAVNAAVQQQQVAERQRELVSRAVEFDDYVGSLGDEYHDSAIFGKGRERDIEKGTPAWNNRAQAFSMMMDIENALLMRGQRNIDRRQIAEQAAWATVGKSLHEARKRKMTEKIDKASKTFTNPPSSRSSAAIPSDMRASLDKMMRGWGKDPKTGDDL